MLHQPPVPLVLAAAHSHAALHAELAEAFEQAEESAPGLFSIAAELTPGQRWPHLAFAQQLLPEARAVAAASINAWAKLLVEAIAGVLPDGAPWALHVFPFEEQPQAPRFGARAEHTRARRGEPAATAPVTKKGVGDERCRLIRESVLGLLQKRRRHLGRYVRPANTPFLPEQSLVQLLLTAPDRGFLSLAMAPTPFEQRHLISCLPGGRVEVASDPKAPSRAFAKLVEAETRMGRRIGGGERCVDLGASPGGWTYVAARRGARVIAVDRSELRADLMQQRAVHFERGDAFRFTPAQRVDWLLCDVIASAERSSALLLHWLRQRWCRHFVVTLKLDQAASTNTLASLKQQLPELTHDAWLLRLCANKNELCVFGTADAPV